VVFFFAFGVWLALSALRVMPTSVARWVSAAKTPRCGVFANGVAQSASFEARLCIAHKTTHDGDRREAITWRRSWCEYPRYPTEADMRLWRAMKNPTSATKKGL